VKNAEEHHAGQGEALPAACKNEDGKKLIRTPQRRQVVGDHQAGDADEYEPIEATSRASVRRSIKAAIGQRITWAPQSIAACGPLPGPGSRAPSQVQRDQIGRGQNGQAQEPDEEKLARHGRAEHDLEIQQGPRGACFMDEEREDEHGAARQQRPHQP